MAFLKATSRFTDVPQVGNDRPIVPIHYGDRKILASWQLT